MPLTDSQTRYVNFYTDFAFKKLFGTEANKDLLLSFLNSRFEGQEHFVDITYLNTEQLGVSARERRAVFDVYCESERGEKILIEMQNGEQEYFKDRSIFYSTFPIREQAKKGRDWNYELKRVYTICFLNFTFDENDEFSHEVKLTDVTTGEVFYDKLTYLYLEMPKYKKALPQLNTLYDKWLYAIKHLGDLDERPSELKEAIFNRLFELAEIAKYTPQERQDYEESLKNFRDWYSVLWTAEKKGHAEGLLEGRAEGHAEGLLEGRAEGRAEGLLEGAVTKAQEIALQMISDQMPVDLVAKYSGLSLEEVKSLQVLRGEK
ncbi:MAG: Rpn family recombination-promoting nuclease/putative transposase [Bacteroidales bacterium]|nr:Rpn family recombination-promoting nuclease/putative transposase [Candidatus Physcousia equi]